MDLSWCIICDNRIVDDELSMIDSNDLLYCSQECKLKDQQHQQLSNAPSFFTPVIETSSSVETTKPLTMMKPWMTKKSAKHHMYRFNSPTTTSYPWVLLYRKRHNYLSQSKRCCQPTVAGSPATATGILSSLIR